MSQMELSGQLTVDVSEAPGADFRVRMFVGAMVSSSPDERLALARAALGVECADVALVSETLVRMPFLEGRPKRYYTLQVKCLGRRP